jgi:hypothetical protein
MLRKSMIAPMSLQPMHHGRKSIAALSLNRPSSISKAIAAVVAIGALVGAAQPAAAQFLEQGPKLVGTGATDKAEQGSYWQRRCAIPARLEVDWDQCDRRGQSRHFGRTVRRRQLCRSGRPG